MLTWDDVEFPKYGKQAHTIKSSREEGEASLSHIAMESNREYVWQYDDENSEWRFVPSKAFKQTERKFGIGKAVAQRFGAVIPDEIYIPSGNESTMYHTHPRAELFRLSKEVLRIVSIKNQFPSSEDVKMCVETSRNGYKDFRIVTEIGVTSLKYNDDLGRTETGGYDIPAFSAPYESIALLSQNYGVVDTIEEMVANMNDVYEGKITVNFNEL